MSVAEDLINRPSTSPFVEGTNVQWAWDSTSLEWFKRCPRLYQYKMIEGWRPKDESIHLRFGIEYHQALHEYDIHRQHGESHNDAVRIVVRELLQRTTGWRPDDKHKNRDNLVRAVIWYLDIFSAEEDPARTYVLADGSPACEVSFRFELDYGPFKDQPYVLCGHLDRVVTFQDELFVMDRKTTKNTPTDWYFNQFEPNNQMTLYTLAGQIVLSAVIKGVIIDTMQTAIEFSRPVRSITYRTKDQLDEWLKDLTFHLAKAEDYAAEGYWPMNDTSCDKYGGCEFRGICSKSPAFRDSFLKSRFTQEERWNPLAVR